ncbi:MAG: PBP1A family penicillin-binding protein, partial [Spirochaetaceae bacterium]
MLLGSAGALLALVVGLVHVLAIMSAAPPVEREYQALETTVVYARGNEVLAGIYEEDRIHVSLEDIPPTVRNAFIAVEDRNFYSHPGVDPWAILRALYANLRHGRIVEGGSTITQQLARNLYLDRSRTIRRKLQEVRIAFSLEQTYSKDQILEMYLNHIYLGSGAYGVQAAANRYFDKDVDELSVEQAALLAALPRAPNYYSPLNNPEAAKGRRNLVLQRMSQNNYLSEADASEAAAQPLVVSDPIADRHTGAPYFVEHVRRELLQMFEHEMVYGEGLVVHTTLDIETQTAAEAALEKAVADGIIPTRRFPDGAEENPIAELQPQYALVTMEVESGAIRSMVGGRGDDEYNRAVQARRHPGSAFKPFIYAAAISGGDHPGTVVNDIPRIAEQENDTHIVWPRNFDDRYRGLVTYRRALARSINTAAVEVLRAVGIQQARGHIDRYGFTSLTARDGREDHYSLALGGLDQGVSPLEMAAAYGAFAAGGVAPRPYAIKKITDRDGQILYRAPPSEDPSSEELYFQYIRYGLTPPHTEALDRDQSLSEAEAYIMTDMLRSVVEDGTGTAAALDIPVAGKTGTSDQNHDAWFVGYTQGLVSAVWIGEDSPQPMRYRRTTDGELITDPDDPEMELTGVHASVVWGDYMRRVIDADEEIANRSDPAFDPPEQIISIEIDPFTGRAPEEHSPQTVEEITIDDSPLRVPWAFSVHMPTLSSIKQWLDIRDANEVRNDAEQNAAAEPFWSDIETVALAIPSRLPLPLSTTVFEQLLEVEHDSPFAMQREYLRDSGILLGPVHIELGGAQNLETVDGEQFSGIYTADQWEPLQRIDPDSGLPVDAEQPQFQRIFPILPPAPTDQPEPAPSPL